MVDVFAVFGAVFAANPWACRRAGDYKVQGLSCPGCPW